LIQYPRSLPDGQSDPRPMLNCLGKNVPRFVEIIAGVKQAIDLRNFYKVEKWTRDGAHLGTFAAMGFVACAGLTMMRQEERPLRTIILVMVNREISGAKKHQA
jgi:hypothetical protein